MTKIAALRMGVVAAFLCGASVYAAEGAEQQQMAHVVNDVIRPLMLDNGIPGMAIGITVRGKRYFFNYGVAAKESGQPVSDDTLFEIGSISKTFTATLVSYAQVRGTLSLDDKASKYLPELKGSSFDAINLLELATYTAGGLPLQFPNEVRNEQTMIAYYKNWRPTYVAGTHRLYSNPSIGLFGYLAARSMHEPFDDLMEGKIIPALGMKNTYIRVPENQMSHYAYGYANDGKPIRVTPGAMDSETYGVKTTTADMVQFVEANMNDASLEVTLQRAITATHTGYFKVGTMTQGLGWEMYAYPTSLDDLLAGNSAQVMLEANEVIKLVPPKSPQTNVLINKTGSTNGFGAYVVYIPSKRIGIVMLANRNYPIPARVKAAYQILTLLDGIR